MLLYSIGEALLGSGPEIAHIDLLIGDKEGPVGQAFAVGFTHQSAGHTPLLAVIRPNLLTKPCTLIIPKVTVKSLEQANRVFGPGQAAVAKAVADLVEEGLIPEDKLDEWIIVCGVFIHPDAKDYRRIYQYNYGATRLALRRALERYPDLKKMVYEKDRARHPIMGFRVPRLWRPPYLQVSLDLPDLEAVKKVVSQLPESDQLILDAGAPLIKRYGVEVIGKLRSATRADVFIAADLKAMDVGRVEVDLAFEQTADAALVSASAPPETIEKFIDEARKCGIYSYLDLTPLENPLPLLKRVKEKPDVVVLDHGVDVEAKPKYRLELMKRVKEAYKKVLVAVSGRITPEDAPTLLKEGADILIVGRYITQAKDVENATRGFLRHLRGDIDLMRVHHATE